MNVSELRAEAKKLGYTIIKTNPPRVAKYRKCQDCKWLDTEHRCSIGYKCTNPDKYFRTKTAMWKYKHTKSCKLFENKGVTDS